jgi:hypothetical protein
MRVLRTDVMGTAGVLEPLPDRRLHVSYAQRDLVSRERRNLIWIE